MNEKNMSKTIKYRGFEIQVEKIGSAYYYVATIYDENGEVAYDEGAMLMDTRHESIEDAKEFIDAITKPLTPKQPDQE